MIDFDNKPLFKLQPDASYSSLVRELLLDGEQVVSSFKSMRDGVVFTNLRLIAVNVQGFTGKKKDFTSLPYSKVVAFSVETAGTLDLDSELELYFSGLGRVRFEFGGRTDILKICRFLSEKIL